MWREALPRFGGGASSHVFLARVKEQVLSQILYEHLPSKKAQSPQPSEELGEWESGIFGFSEYIRK